MECIAAFARNVVVSREDNVRHYCGKLRVKELKKLTQRKFINDYSEHKCLSKIAHDQPGEDAGYVRVFDSERSRYIFFAGIKVSLSDAFCIDKEITSLFNVMSPCNLHLSYDHMTPKEKKWQLNNLKYVALQVYDTIGNVVLFCNHGRSRSPMYVVVYLIIFHDLTVHDAMTKIAGLLHTKRGLVLDRYNTLVPAAAEIYKNIIPEYNV